MVILAKKNLREFRKMAGLSIGGLAEKAGVNPATISYIENSRRHPSPPTAKKICDALNRSFDEIFELKEANHGV